jgi:hypothetical protein
MKDYFKQHFGLYICCAASMSASVIACKLALDSSHKKHSRSIVKVADIDRTVVDAAVRESESRNNAVIKKYYDDMKSIQEQCISENKRNKEEIQVIIKRAKENIDAKIEEIRL